MLLLLGVLVWLANGPGRFGAPARADINCKLFRNPLVVAAQQAIGKSIGNQTECQISMHLF